jgi:hypothetical protein
MKHRTRKDRRHALTGAKSIDSSCRNHGSCPYCLSARTVKNKKREHLLIEIMKEDEELGLYQKIN